MDSSWPFYPLAFLHDVACCLALVHQDRLQLDSQGRLQIGSVARLAAACVLKPETPQPLSEAQAPGLSFLIGLLGHGGLIAAVDQDGASLRLSAASYDWLGLPAHRQIEQLRQIWWFSPASSTRWLPPSRHQRPLDGHWQAVIAETARWVVALPTGEWTPSEGLSHYLAAQGMTDAGATVNLITIRRAAERRTLAFGEFLLQVVLPRLGIVEIDHEQAQALRVRPTSEGATWLRAALSRSSFFLAGGLPDDAAVELTIPAPELRLAHDPAGGRSLQVGADLEIVISLGAPAVCTFDVAHVSELLSPGPPARYRLTRDSLHQALAWGYPVSDLLFLLAYHGAGSLPPSVLTQVAAWQEEMVTVACEPGYRLHLAAPEILAALRGREPFRQRTSPLASGQDAWVSAAQAEELFRYLRRVGYLLHGDRPTAGIPIHVSRPLPLAQLLVVIRTYQHLRRLIPGLADPELGDLDRAIAAALAPDDLAGAERLVKSHLVFLRCHLKQGGRGAEEQESGQAEGQGGGGAEEQAGGEEASSAPEDLTRRLQAAIDAGGALELTYADAKGNTVRRRVHPLHLETRWGRRYLLAYCELRQDERRFRLDRIVSIGD